MVSHSLTWADDEFAVARAYFDALDAAHSPPAPAGTPTPPPSPTPVLKPLVDAADWVKELNTRWSITCSPETVTGSNVSKNASVTALWDTLIFSLRDVKAVGQAGARLLYDPRKLRTWDGLKDCYGHTVEFLNTWNFPAEIANYYGDGGFESAGWQFKADATPGANASMAMNLHTFRGVGMRWWLQSNSFAARAEDDTFPVIPVGVDVETRLLVHFDSDPAKGWMQLEYAGKTLRVTGTNMAANGICGAYLCLYGNADGVMLVKRTVITVLD